MYHFYLDGLELPITPDKLTVRGKNKNKLVTLINEGEVNILKTPGLEEIAFEFVLPAQAYPFRATEPLSQSSYLLRLRRLKAARQPFRFIISRVAGGRVTVDEAKMVSLEDYDIIESWDEGRDIRVKVQLREYRQIGNRQALIQLNQLSLLGKPRQRVRMGSACGSGFT